MRYNILGSTNTQNGDATAATATSPKTNTLMSCLPADLRAVMRPMCVYTVCDLPSGAPVPGASASVTATIDFLPLLAELEIHGVLEWAYSSEKDKQTQYAYFKNGNSKVKYKHSSQSSTGIWWSRSLIKDFLTGCFCCVDSDGTATNTKASNSDGVAPMFKV